MKEENIHIFGAGGFIGSNLLEEFLKDKRYKAQGYSSQDCNFLSLGSLEKNLSKLSEKDIVIMASSITRLKENSFSSMIKNIKMAENMGKVIKEKKIARLIFLSTCDVYGIYPKQPITEDNQTNPYDYYAISKLSSEFILKRNCEDNKIPLLILRLNGVYGPKDNGKSIINKLVESAKDGKVIVYGDGTDTRDFTYVKDIYELINRGIENKINATLNLATGKSYSINEIVELIGKYFNRDFLVEYKKKQGEVRIKKVKYDISNLKKIFPDFKPTILEKGIFSYIQSYKIFK